MAGYCLDVSTICEWPFLEVCVSSAVAVVWVLTPVNHSLNSEPEACAVLGFYAARNVSFLLTFRNNVSVQGWTVRLSRNVGRKLTLQCA